MALKSLFTSGAGLFGFLARPLDPDQALARVTEDVTRRDERFLDSARKLIYADPSSPYRRLLEWSHCSYADLVSAVRRQGIEATLEELYAAGVFITLDEYKGLIPIVRSGLDIEVNAAAFETTDSAGGIAASTGGSRSAGTEVMFGWNLIAEHAATEILLEQLHGALDGPMALWLPVPPGLAGIHAVLIHAKYRRRYDRWFTQVPRYGVASRSIDQRTMRLGSRAIDAACALYGCRVPRPEVVPAAEARKVATWMAEQVAAGKPPVVRAYASGAVRIAESAIEEELDLEGSIIICGGEPVTTERFQYVSRAGIHLIPRYSSADAGLIGASCNQVKDVDDMHIYTNRFAAIIGGRENRTSGDLYLTTISPNTSRVLLNTSIGDTASLSSRSCSCTFGLAGMDLHLADVRSSEKITHEGMNVNVTELERLTWEIVERAGGTPADFQFWSVESTSGISRLELLIDPKLELSGDLETELLQRLGTELRGGALTAEMWSQSTALKVRRRTPGETGSGKVHPLMMRRE